MSAAELIPAGQPMGHTGAIVVREASPLDANPAEFRGALVRRGENRKSLIDWVRDALVDGTDFGKIHTKNKRECKHGGPPKCTPEQEPWHWSKPTLRKPGAEKICGMLGLNPTFPTLKEYEALALQGMEIKSIILRCHLLTADERVVAEGIGARNVESDYGDLNKALKMAAKSAQIDATLRCAGLSEIFTQDLEDMVPAGSNQPAETTVSEQSQRERPAQQRPAGRPQTQPPRSNNNSGGGDGVALKCTERQEKLLRVKIDQAGIGENAFLDRFEIDTVRDLPFGLVNEALAWIQKQNSDDGRG